MFPVLVKIGDISIYSWGFMLAIAMVVAIWGVGRLLAREGYDSGIAIDIVMVMIVAGLVGARSLYIITFEWQNFLAHPLMFFAFPSGGLIWYGGFIGGLVGFVIYVWKKGLSFWHMADVLAPFAALGYAIVRLGCFLNGCCFGNITNSKWGVVFHVVDNHLRYPTQLFSSAVNLLLFFILLNLFPRRKFPGQVFLVYLIGYSIYRFIIEFYRFNVQYYANLSIAQLISIGLFIAGVMLYIWKRPRHGNL
ncbi:MAG: prolipoprotein diacylglyceryl transferase [Syntrophomonadaceae bacterium]